MVSIVAGKFYIGNHNSINMIVSPTYPNLTNIKYDKTTVSYPWELSKVTMKLDTDLYAVIIRSSFGYPRISTVGKIIPAENKKIYTLVKVILADKFYIEGDFDFEIMQQSTKLCDFIIKTKKEKRIWF